MRPCHKTASLHAVTEEERRAFRAALAARRERVAMASRAFAPGAVRHGRRGGAAAPTGQLVGAAIGFVAFAGLLFRLANWKCSACGERLPTRGGRVCRGCGAAIDE